MVESSAWSAGVRRHIIVTLEELACPALYARRKPSLGYPESLPALALLFSLLASSFKVALFLQTLVDLCLSDRASLDRKKDSTSQVRMIKHAAQVAKACPIRKGIGQNQPLERHFRFPIMTFAPHCLIIDQNKT
jgi:hypothetical protein